MADQNCSSPSSPNPVTITSTTEEKSDADELNSLPSSCDSRNLAAKICSSSDENEPFKTQPPQKNIKLLFSDPTITSSSDYKSKIPENGKNEPDKKASVLRPSILSSGFSSLSSKTTDGCTFGSLFSLKSSKLDGVTPKFGDGPILNTPVTVGNVFTNSVMSDKTESTLNNSSKIDKNSSDIDGNESKPVLGIFSNTLIGNSNASDSGIPKTASVISVPNFVFGQNLHERVTDTIKATNSNHSAVTETKSNGTPAMLFSSVLTSKEVKENLSNEGFGSSKESSSLIEDAARCEEARASNKRKYEEVIVTTGEEDEENILQVNVKLFAFDNGTWLERGRGILRLNDKKSDGKTTSRIVIRTIGSLRVVLNTKIWSGMSLNRASERSTRITAVDPNGQVKIYLIQASFKDMASLYPLLESRVQTSKEIEEEREESPNKKLALEKDVH